MTSNKPIDFSYSIYNWETDFASGGLATKQEIISIVRQYLKTKESHVSSFTIMSKKQRNKLIKKTSKKGES